METETTSQPTAPESSAGGEQNTGLAVLAHVLGIFTGFVGALIIYLVEKDEGFTKEEAKEALNFQITVAIAYVAAWILAFVFIGFLLWFIVWAANIIFCIMAAVAASKSQSYKYPATLRLIK